MDLNKRVASGGCCSSADLVRLASEAAFHDSQFDPLNNNKGIRFFPRNLGDYMWKLAGKKSVDILIPGNDTLPARFYRLDESKLAVETIDFATEEPHAIGENVYHVLKAYNLFMQGNKLD